MIDAVVNFTLMFIPTSLSGLADILNNITFPHIAVSDEAVMNV